MLIWVILSNLLVMSVSLLVKEEDRVGIYYHSSLSSLLPILPNLINSDGNLLITIATQPFKSLLLNFICFLPPQQSLLVITPDHQLATHLAHNNITVWYIQPTNSLSTQTQPLLHHTFLNLSLLDLLLLNSTTANQILPWGTLHYQSLMLLRTIVVTTLVGALEDSQKITHSQNQKIKSQRKQQIIDHDWEKGSLPPQEFNGVRGILLADNDAVWLSSPNSFLSHPYRTGGFNPAIIYSQDMDPETDNAWGTKSMPCACFIYFRLNLIEPPLPSKKPLNPTKLNSKFKTPKELKTLSDNSASSVLKLISLCHISMIQESFLVAKKRNLQFEIENSKTLNGTESLINTFTKATAPSFQASVLGPVLWLMEQDFEILPFLSQKNWLKAIGSGQVQDLEELLAVLYSLVETEVDERGVCFQLTRKNYQISKNPHHFQDFFHPFSTFPLSSTFEKYTAPYEPLKVEALPFLIFPPGMEFFDKEKKPTGIVPIVVHANYASGSMKEELLRREGLWALRSDESCSF